MHKAALYHQSNGLQRRDAEQIITEFASIMHWRSDGGDSVLDIGCGSGDVTIDYLLPVLPKKFQRLVGVDLSGEMVEYARKQYGTSRISFEQFDLGIDLEKQLLRQIEQFDHVVSFYCLHWVQQQEKAIQNLYKLCKPDGDVLVIFLAQNPIFEIYQQMANTKRWSKYMTDVERFISPYQNSNAPAEDFSRLLLESGFREFQVEVREKVYMFEGIDLLKSG